MRKSKVAQKIRENAPIKLAMLGHFIPRFVKDAAMSGYDGIWLDLEHRTLSYLQVQHLLLLGHHYDIDILIRPATRERANLYRYLEDGATGLIMPHISDLETAQELVNAVKFPPIGDRGIEAQGLETNYGYDHAGDLSKLTTNANEETLLCLQIETPWVFDDDGVATIAQLPGVDMLYYGPADMRIRLAELPEDERPTPDAQLQRFSEIVNPLNVTWGCMPRTPADVQHFRDLGAQIHVWGRDHFIVRDALSEMGNALDDLIENGHN